MVMKKAVLLVAVTAMGFSLSGTEGAMVRKSDDPEPLERVVQYLADRQISMNAQLHALENSITKLKVKENQRVVFTASIHPNNVQAAPGHIIPFSRVITNEGNAYDANTGAFTAPYDGQYMFFVSVDVSADYKNLDIYRNGQVIIPGHNDAGDHHIFAGGAITLKAGDEVTIRHHTGAVGSVDGGPEAIFCGFKI